MRHDSWIRGLGIACLAITAGFAQDRGGKLTIYMAGKPVAHETYTITSADKKVTLDGSGSAALGTMKIDIDQFKVVMDDKFQPIQADAHARLGTMQMSASIAFADGKAKAQTNTGQGPQSREADVHPDDLVVNANLPLYPWSVLALRANFSDSAPQEFHAYIVGQVEATIAVVYKGRESVQFAARKADLQHVSATFAPPQGDAITLDLWVDENRRLAKLAVPSQNVEAYQEGFDPKPSEIAPDAPKATPPPPPGATPPAEMPKQTPAPPTP